MRVLITLILTTNLLFALSDEQVKNMKVAYKVGKTIKANNGMTFENTLVGIMGQESSWGKYVLGDKYDNNGKLKSVYESSLGAFQIKLSTAKYTIRKVPELYKKYRYLLYDGRSIYLEYEYHKSKMNYYVGVINNPTWVKRFVRGEDKAIRTFAWAKKELKRHKETYLELRNKAAKDTLLINKLFTDVRFSAEIAGHYLKMQYDYAISKGWSKAYKRSVGRYNGGWDNWEYADRVLKRMRITKEIF
jgi:hypothetical protein